MEARQQIPPDAELLVRVQAGDQGAIALLYDAHSAVIYTLALNMLGCVESAEDVLHNTFMQLWREPASFPESHGSLRYSLLLSARNHAVELRSRDARSRRSQEPQPASGQAAG
jgi:RNA polymerase sigma-70 factor (ECF subfamily)